MKSTYILLTSLTILLMLCSSCGKEEVGISSESAPQPPEQGTVVFLDVSTSIRGYFRTTDRKASSLQRFLQREFCNSISENNLIPLYFSMFSEKVVSPQQVEGNICDMFFFDSDDEIKKLFSDGSTDFLGVFEKEEFGKYKVSMIITDSLHSGTGGYDIGDMIRVIKPKIEEGLCINLIGIKSEFEGFVFPVISEHADPFWHKGLRPIYIWIATRDSKLGNSLTKDIVTRLEKETQEENVKCVKLSNVQLPSVTNIEFDINSEDYLIIPNGENFDVKLARSLKDRIEIPLSVTNNLDDCGKQWKLNMKLEPEIEWANIVENGEDWTISLAYNQIPSGTLFKSGGGMIKVKVIATSDIQQFWWRERESEGWSTENDSNEGDADKTPYLERLGEKLIEPLYSKEHELKFLVLKITKM